MSAITLKIVTMTWECGLVEEHVKEPKYRTVVIAPTIVIITLAMAEMMALIPRPIAEKMEP
jgi:hypothetical protein